MKRMSPEAKVGLLVLAGLLILVYMALRVGKLGFGPQGGYTLYLRLDNASGLNKDGEVLVAGIPVGQIDEIRLEGKRALLVLHIRDGVQLPRDSTASVRTHGVLGERFVEVVPGASPEFLRDGDVLNAGPPPGDLDRLVARLTDISKDVKQVTERLANVFGTPQGEQNLRDIVAGLRDTATGLRDVVAANRQALKETIANLRALTAEFREMLAANRQNIDDTLASARSFSQTLAERTPRIADSLEKLTGDLDQVVTENRDDLRQTLTNLRESTAKLSGTIDAAQELLIAARSPQGTLGRLMTDDSLYRDLRSAAGELNAVLGRMDKGEGTLGKLLSDDSLYTELEGSAANLKSIAEKIDKGEGTLGKLVNDKSVHDNLNSTLTGITEFVSGGNRLQFEVGFESDYLAALGKSKSSFNVDVRPRQDRFYRFSLVNDPRGKESTETLEIKNEITGQMEKVKKTKTEDKFKVSAQVAKRFSFLTLRGGLIESSGGAGADLSFWDDRLKLTLDAFDFARNDGGPHVTLGARWDFLQHFYVTGGLDDFLYSKRSDVFVGAGVRFLDDDLKYILSPAASFIK
ncbi:MAG: MCE family protein [Deltaproteobacteria bacterium]|nr:MCE family protein [Deltaproteobacteria bacterium]